MFDDGEVNNNKEDNLMIKNEIDIIPEEKSK